MVLQKEDSSSFIVRIRVEERDDQGNAIDWRVLVEHVQTKETQYFGKLEQAFQFIQARSGVQERR
ncbi:hypothetical protein HYR54_15290 [Candidatus Acetothermia bacterium]|nr:hypothetical protein [Candidatus Acetothermia bacterium]